MSGPQGLKGPLGLDTIQEIELTRYLALAGCTILFWDWLMTLTDEVTHIWPTPWSAVKFLFLFTRYGNLILVPIVVTHLIGLSPTQSDKICRRYILGYGTFVYLSITAIHILVVFRVWIVWGKRRWVTVVLGISMTFYLVTCTPMIVYAFVIARDMFIINYRGSCMWFAPPTLWFIWIASLMLESVSFVLMLLDIWNYRRRTDSAFRILSRLRQKIYVAATLFVLLAAIIHISNIVFWARYSKRPFNILAVTICYCLTNVAGQRFVLDLRQLNLDRSSLSTMSFQRLSRIDLPSISTLAFNPDPSIYETAGQP